MRERRSNVRQPVRSGFFVAAMLLCATGTGCQPATNPGGDPASIPSGPLIEDAVWPFWPDSMRLHPLTCLTEDAESEQPVIELRLEFADAYGHTTKCVGVVRAELHDRKVVRDAQLPDGRTWSTELNRLGLNQVHYDEVTRTYLLRLFMEPGILPEEPVLRVLFESMDGRVLEATRPLSR